MPATARWCQDAPAGPVPGRRPARRRTADRGPAATSRPPRALAGRRAIRRATEPPDQAAVDDAVLSLVSLLLHW
jgi:hypothetical protein